MKQLCPSCKKPILEKESSCCPGIYWHSEEWEALVKKYGSSDKAREVIVNIIYEGRRE